METKGRRYPRVLLLKGPSSFSKIAGVEAHWPKGQKTGVIDISFVGAAVVQPKDHSYSDLEKGNTVQLEFHFLENNKKAMFNCEVVRTDDRCIAFHFPELSVEARQVLQKFMQTKVIGMNMRLVDSKHYIKEQGFNYWYHGPNQTNIFIWGDKKSIKRATVELETRVLNIQDGKLFESQSTDFLYVPTEDYGHQVNNAENTKVVTTKDTFVKQVIAFLEQVPDTKGLIEKVVESIK